MSKQAFPETPAPDRLYRISLDLYHAMAESGVLNKRHKVVLLDGLLVIKKARSPRHVCVTHLLWDDLRDLAPESWHVRKGDPLSLLNGPGELDSEPEPDLFVVSGGTRDYTRRHPGPHELALVVEVSENSLRDDRAGLIRYAWARIPVAWIVNLTNETVEVYTRPSGPADPAGYEDSMVYQKDDRIPVIIDGREVGRVAVRDLLP